MQLPQNIMQIGTLNEFYRIYMEDYVYTYLKQLEQDEHPDKVKVYLFGKQEYKQDEMFLYIFGAVDSDRGILSIQHEFLPEYDILGIMTLNHSQKEISLQNGTSFKVNGFFVFYEQNPAMQAFLVYNYQEKEIPEPEEKIEIPKPYIKQRDPEILKQYQNKKKNSKNNGIYALTYAMAIFLCIVTITAINRYDKLQGFNQDILQAGNLTANQMEETHSEEIFQEDIYIEELIETEASIPESEETEQPSTYVEETTQTEEAISLEETTVETEPEQEETKYKEYIIKKGDSLAKICRNLYGNEEKLKEVCVINDIENPDEIIQGQKIFLP